MYNATAVQIEVNLVLELLEVISAGLLYLNIIKFVHNAALLDERPLESIHLTRQYERHLTTTL